MEKELEKIKYKLLDDFIRELRNRNAGTHEEVFSYSDIYKIIIHLHYTQDHF